MIVLLKRILGPLNLHALVHVDDGHDPSHLSGLVSGSAVGSQSLVSDRRCERANGP